QSGDRYARAGGYGPPLARGGQGSCGAAHLPLAWLMARHSRSGVAGISTWRMPRCESASTSALATAGMAPTQPASPAPFTPSGLVLVGTGLLLTSMALRSVARGIA